MNRKGFVLLETIVVLLVTVVSMLGLYLTYSFVFKNLNQTKYYDNINDVYKLNIFYNMMYSDIDTGRNGYIIVNSNNCSDKLFGDYNCMDLMNKLGFEYIIYTDKDLDIILSSTSQSSELKNTDINYIKRLEHNYSYLIGVYKSNKDENYYYVSLKVGELE